MKRMCFHAEFGHRPRLAALGAMFAAILGGCKVGPEYHRPTAEIPPAFKSATETSAGPSHLGSDWWTLFGDETLSTLEKDSLAGSLDLRAATARVLQARAASGAVASQFYPVVTLDPSITRSRSSVNRGSGGATTQTTVLIPFDMSYEIDIWGRVRHAYDASTAQVRASEADFGVVLLTLTADVAQNYFTLRYLDAQEKVLSQSIDLYQSQIKLTKTQQRSGIVGQTDVLQAQTLLDTAQAQIVDVRRQRADTEHALAILTGHPPSTLSLMPMPMDGVPPLIPAGLPSDLLGQRPDVAEAEQALVAACASVGVAKANFYPVVRLTGTAGFESLDIQHALDWQSRIWSIGPSVNFPIFEGGKLRAELAQAKARFDEVDAQYRSTILRAFGEVEDSLTNLHMRADAAAAQNRAVDSSREYLRLAQLQYSRGLIGYLQVIDAERTLLNNELTALQILSQRYISTALLIKALGGGWRVEDAESTTQPSERADPHH